LILGMIIVAVVTGISCLTRRGATAH
jgi:hypothetical protein